MDYLHTALESFLLALLKWKRASAGGVGGGAEAWRQCTWYSAGLLLHAEVGTLPHLSHGQNIYVKPSSPLIRAYNDDVIDVYN